VVDRLKQRRSQTSYDSGNAVCYVGGGLGANIFYGHNGECENTATDMRWKAGLKAEVEVELAKGIITFTISSRKFKQSSSILIKSHREFVPYFEMAHKDDRISWSIQ
jgi:hypothetical protein